MSFWMKNQGAEREKTNIFSKLNLKGELFHRVISTLTVKTFTS